jgi:hypothetical protein
MTALQSRPVRMPAPDPVSVFEAPVLPVDRLLANPRVVRALWALVEEAAAARQPVEGERKPRERSLGGV